MTSSDKVRNLWALRKFRCRDTGVTIIIPADVKPNEVFTFGKCTLKVNTGYCGVLTGNWEEMAIN